MAVEEKVDLGTIDLSEKTDLPKKYLCVDLDCLLDTRLPLACMVDPMGMARMLEENKYLHRKKDIFGNIPEMVFKQLYSRRDKKLLEAARPTPMIDFVKDTFADMAFDTTRLAYDFDVGIFINMYPYNFHQGELDSLMIMFKNVYTDIDIQFINKSIDELNPKFVRKNVGILIKYDLMYWLEYHTAKLNIFETHIFETSLVAPMVGMGSIKKKDINEEYFKNVKQHNNKIANLEFLPVCMFSFNEKGLDWKALLKEE